MSTTYNGYDLIGYLGGKESTDTTHGDCQSNGIMAGATHTSSE